jgi:hypothetical protein
VGWASDGIEGGGIIVEPLDIDGLRENALLHPEECDALTIPVTPWILGSSSRTTPTLKRFLIEIKLKSVKALVYDCLVVQQHDRLSKLPKSCLLLP